MSFFFQAEDGIRDLVRSRGLGDVYKRQKLGSGDWRSHVGNRHSLFVNASAWGLLLTGKVIRLQQDDTESAWRMLRQTVGRAGEPAIRTAMRLAMNIMGTQFVLGTDIDAALDKSKEWLVRGYRYSYDMLGEGARTATSAGEYHAVYCASIERVGQHSRASDPVSGPGFSVKLSALHPRLELAQGKRTRAELVPPVLELAQLAPAPNIGLTLHAQKAHRPHPMGADRGHRLGAGDWRQPRRARPGAAGLRGLSPAAGLWRRGPAPRSVPQGRGAAGFDHPQLPLCGWQQARRHHGDRPFLAP